MRCPKTHASAHTLIETLWVNRRFPSLALRLLLFTIKQLENPQGMHPNRAIFGLAQRPSEGCQWLVDDDNARFTLEVCKKLAFTVKLDKSSMLFYASYLAWEAHFQKVALKHERGTHFQLGGDEVVFLRILVFLGYSFDFRANSSTFTVLFRRGLKLSRILVFFLATFVCVL